MSTHDMYRSRGGKLVNPSLDHLICWDCPSGIIHLDWRYFCLWLSKKGLKIFTAPHLLIFVVNLIGFIYHYLHLIMSIITYLMNNEYVCSCQICQNRYKWKKSLTFIWQVTKCHLLLQTFIPNWIDLQTSFYVILSNCLLCACYHLKSCEKEWHSKEWKRLTPTVEQ